MARIKIVVAVVIAVLLLIIVLQNRAEVETKFLFITMTMPRAVLLFVAALAGFVLGLVAAFGFSRRAKTPNP